MDPNSGKLYTEEEAKELPQEVQDRLVPAPRHVRRRARGNNVVKMTHKDMSQQRRKNKQARKSRKINRK